jgi:hypothetical protein
MRYSDLLNLAGHCRDLAQEAVALEPEQPAAALAYLGDILNDQGRSEEALASY